MKSELRRKWKKRASILLMLVAPFTVLAVNPPTTISPGSASSPGTTLSTLTPTFSWNAASGATGYGLYIRDLTASGTPLIYPNSSGTTTTPLTGTSFNLPSGYLVNGHAYRWNMTSFVGSTETTAASSVLYFQAPATIAGPPTINSPGSTTSPGPVLANTTPTFSWNAASGATGYGLYIRDLTASGTPLVYPNSSGTTTTPLTGTSFNLPSGYLVNGHAYRWNMTSFTGSTESSTASSVLYFQGPAVIAGPPTINSPGDTTSPGPVLANTTPTFSWNAASGATGYGLYIRDLTASGTPLIYPNSSGTTTTPLTGTSFNLPSGYLVNGHAYRWNMTSFTGSTESSTASSVLYFQGPAVIAGPPTINSPGDTTSPGPVLANTTPTFSWNAASGATGYGLYIRDLTASGTPLIYPNSSGTTTTPLTGTSFNLPSGYLVNGHAYRWNMTSFTGSTESSTASSVLYFQGPAVIAGPPTINSPGGVSLPGPVVANVTPTFSWNAASGATGYGLYIRDLTASGTPLVYPNSSGTTTTPLTGTSLTLPSGYLVTGHNYVWNMSSFVGSTESTTFSTPLYFQEIVGSGGPESLGVDVSEFNGTVTWSQVSNPGGKSFAIIRATAGINTTDAQFAQNAGNAHGAGLIIGAYHFAYPQYFSAHDEAQKFLSVASSYIGVGFLPPALDIEDSASENSFPYQLGQSTLSQWIRDWCSAVKQATGVTPMIYTTRDYANKYFDSNLNQYPLWVATYPTFPNSDPGSIGPWTTWTFQQYRTDPATQKTDPNSTVEPNTPGICPGITGYSDLDSFNGDITALNRLIGIGGGGGTAPIIGNAKLTGTTFTLTVPTQAGSNYVLEYKNTMADLQWTPVQTNSGNGAEIGLTNTGAVGPSRFYHVRVQ